MAKPKISRIRGFGYERGRVLRHPSRPVREPVSTQHFVGFWKCLKINFEQITGSMGMGKHINKYSNTNQVMVDACAMYNAMVE